MGSSLAVAAFAASPRTAPNASIALLPGDFCARHFGSNRSFGARLVCDAVCPNEAVAGGYNCQELIASPPADGARKRRLQVATKTSPYLLTPEDWAGGEAMAESQSSKITREIAGRAVVIFALRSRLLWVCLAWLFRALIDPAGGLITMGSPADFTTHVEAFFAGGRGLDLDKEEPASLRLANTFQNTWAGRLLTYRAADDIYTYTCDASLLVPGEHPELDALFDSRRGRRTLIPGGSRPGELRFRMVDGILTALIETEADERLFGEGRYPLTHCLYLSTQFYHVMQHQTSGMQSYASQDFRQADDAADGSADEYAPWRLLNADVGEKHDFASLFIQGPFLYSRAFAPDELRVAKSGLIQDFVANPCSPQRYLPVHVPESHAHLFSTTLQRAQRIVCDEANRIELSTTDMALYSSRMRDLLPESAAQPVEAWMPTATAMMLGIEHALSQATGLVLATDFEASGCDPKYVLGGALAPALSDAKDKLAPIIAFVTTLFNIPGIALDGVEGDDSECDWNYWGFQFNPAIVIFGSSTTVMDWKTYRSCKDPDTTERATSIESEMMQVSRLASGAPYQEQLQRMSRDLSALWAEVSAYVMAYEATGLRMQANYSFVFDSRLCVASGTWM